MPMRRAMTTITTTAPTARTGFVNERPVAERSSENAIMKKAAKTTAAPHCPGRDPVCRSRSTMPWLSSA